MNLARIFLTLCILIMPGIVLGADFDKYRPLNRLALDSYTEPQLFDAAYQAYVCSFLMFLSNQLDKGRFLRWYSTQLMMEEKARANGKNWNDVNFPGALDAVSQSKDYAKKFGLTETFAAERLLASDQCKTLDEFTVMALKASRTKRQRLK